MEVSVFNPDGELGTLPAEELDAALRSGFQRAVEVVNADGDLGELPEVEVQVALQSGFKLPTDYANQLKARAEEIRAVAAAGEDYAPLVSEYASIADKMKALEKSESISKDFDWGAFGKGSVKAVAGTIGTAWKAAKQAANDIMNNPVTGLLGTAASVAAGVPLAVSDISTGLGQLADKAAAKVIGGEKGAAMDLASIARHASIGEGRDAVLDVIPNRELAETTTTVIENLPAIAATRALTVPSAVSRAGLMRMSLNAAVKPIPQALVGGAANALPVAALGGDAEQSGAAFGTGAMFGAGNAFSGRKLGITPKRAAKEISEEVRTSGKVTAQDINAAELTSRATNVEPKPEVATSNTPTKAAAKAEIAADTGIPDIFSGMEIPQAKPKISPDDLKAVAVQLGYKSAKEMQDKLNAKTLEQIMSQLGRQSL